MTREEAIEYWEGLRKTFSSQLEQEENHFGRMHLQTTIDALDMAISALRQQETVSNRNGLNEPLTLGELRIAYKFGCPVWLVGMEDGDGWVFIHHVDSCSVRYARVGDPKEWCFRTKSYGVRVFAYLDGPKEEQRDSD